MKKKSLLKRVLLGSVKKDIQEQIDTILGDEKTKWAEETAKELSKSHYTLGRIQDYRSTATGETFKAMSLSSEKKWTLIYNIFSEAPGSPQCADRVRSAVTGGGYLLQPVPGGKKDKKELKKLIEFFDQPNADATIEDIVQNIVTNYYAYGNSYIEKVYEDNEDDDGQGEVVELYTLPSEDMKILVDSDKRKAGVNIPIGYELYVPFAETAKVEDKKIVYELDEVMHFKRPDPRGRLYGRAIFEDNQSVTQLILQALIYNIKTFENSGKPPLKIRLPEGTSSTEAIEFSHFFEKNFQGMHNAGKALILYNNADAGALGLTPQDMQYLQLLLFGLKQVAGMYGVPMIMISQPEGSNRACYSSDTEVLTEEGWKLHSKVKENEKIAIYNKEQDKIYFAIPKKLSSYYVEEKLCYFNNNSGVDLMVTDNHKMWATTDNVKGKYSENKANDLMNKTKVIMKSNAEFFDYGKEQEYFILPKVWHQNHKAHEQEYKIKMDTWLKFLGFFISEGGLYSKGNIDKNYTMTFGQSYKVNNEKVIKIDKMFSELPFKVTRYKDEKEGMIRWNISRKSVWTYLYENVGVYCNEKRIPREFFKVSKRQIRILFDWLMLRDGSYNSDTSFNYHTVSKQLANDFQELVVRLGVNSKKGVAYKQNGNRQKLYRIAMSKITEKHITKETDGMQYIDYKGMVYCFTVDTGYYLTRRNGCIALQGNTSYEETKSFYQRVVQPLRNMICNKLTQQVIVDSFDITDWRLDFQDIDLEDSSKRVEEASKSFMYGTRNWNEARKRMGLEAGTESWQDEFFIVHNGIATPLRDFQSGKAKTQTDRQKEKEEKKNLEKIETKANAKKKAQKENKAINAGKVVEASRADNHLVHIEEHRKVLYTTKEKCRASLRVHIYGHEDFQWEQDEDGNYGRVTGKGKSKK